MSHQDPEHPYSEEPTRATPRIDPGFLDKPNTQEMPSSSGTREGPYGSPPPQYGQSYGQSSEQPYAGGGYDQTGQSYDQPYGQSYGQQYGQQYGQPYQQYPVADPYAYGPPGGFAPPQQSNGMAIASLVTSLSGLLCFITFPIGLILGIVALPTAKRENNSSAKGMAIAGIVIGALGTASIVGLFAFIIIGSSATTG